jgi:hypothetical protein
MFQGSKYAVPERHRVFIRDLLLRSEELKRRAAISAAEQVRRAESLRAESIGYPRALEAVDTLISAVEEMHAALEYLHHTIGRVADEEPQSTRWQRWRVRRLLSKGMRRFERGVMALEKRR